MSTVFIFSMAIFESRGKEAAKTVISGIESGSYNKVFLYLQKPGVALAHLYCGTRNCVAFDIKKNELVYFPQNGHRYMSRKNVTKISSTTR